LGSFGKALLGGRDLPETKSGVSWSFLTKAAQKAALAIAHFLAQVEILEWEGFT